MVSESHSISSTITNHPVATESPISDHMISQPISLTLRGIIGDSIPCQYIDSKGRQPRNPIDAPIFDSDGSQGKILGINTFGSEATSFNANNEGERTRAAWLRLEELRNNKEIISVVTNLKAYDNMVVESVSTESTFQNPDKLDFQITLRQIVRVDVEQSTIRRVEGKSSATETSEKSPPCLKLSDVFLGSGTTTNSGDQSRSETTDARQIKTSGGRITSPFSFDKWAGTKEGDPGICGAIVSRWQSQFLPTRSIQTRFSDTLAGFGSSGPGAIPVVINQDEVDENNANEISRANRASAFLSELCNLILQIETCAIPQTCGDKAYTPPSETEEEEIKKRRQEQVDSPLGSQSVTVLSIQRRDRNTTRDLSLSETLSSVGNNIDDRLRLACYYGEVGLAMRRELVRSFGSGETDEELSKLLDDVIAESEFDFLRKIERVSSG